MPVICSATKANRWFQDPSQIQAITFGYLNVIEAQQQHDQFWKCKGLIFLPTPTTYYRYARGVDSSNGQHNRWHIQIPNLSVLISLLSKLLSPSHSMNLARQFWTAGHLPNTPDEMECCLLAVTNNRADQWTSVSATSLLTKNSGHTRLVDNRSCLITIRVSYKYHVANKT